jgi:hypothetical protein
MALVNVTCGSCGKNLGSYIAPGGEHFGISDNSVQEGRQIDPDCRDCNPNYDHNCKKCGASDIDKTGKCRRCGTVQ